MSEGNVRVLDTSTTLSGLYCSYLLTAAGLAVSRVEPPEGHALRRWRSSHPAAGDDRTGALFDWLATGQQCVVVDPNSPEDIEELREWAGGVDAVLWTPNSALTIEALQAAAPEAVITAISSFGLSGPWAGRQATEFTLQAMAGGPALRGSRAWPPFCAGGRFGEYMSGVFAAVATMVGLRQHAAGGPAGTLDFSMFEALIMTQNFNPHTMETQVGGLRPKRPLATVADIVETKDGYVGFAVIASLQNWLDFCAMIGRPDWADDASLYHVAARSERHEELNPVIQEWAAARTTAEIVEMANFMRIPSIEIGNGETLSRMEAFHDAGYYQRSPAGFLRPAPPFRFDPPIAPTGPQFESQHSGAATPISAAGRPRRTIRPAIAEPPGRLPFEGLRIADFTSYWAGPLVTHLLGMWGADVVHVESTKRLDGSRRMNHHPATEPLWWERSSCYHSTNTNKRGITIDMDTPEGRLIARRLVEQSDVVVENYSPRVMESWGLGWEVVRSLRPDAVMLRMPAFALEGPLRDRTGFAMTMEQVSGMAWLHGYPEHPPGSLMGPCDPNAGLHAFVGLLAALERRSRTGEGCLVESRMVLSALNVAGEQVIEYSAYGVRLDRQGNRGAGTSVQNSYACADWDDDLEQQRWVSVAVETDEQWRGLKSALGCPPWAEGDGFRTQSARRSHQDSIDAHLAKWCAARDADEAVAVLVRHGVPAAAVVHPSANLQMPQLIDRGFFETVHHPVHGDSVHPTVPFRLPGHDGGPVHRRHPPLLGEHNHDVLGELGFSDAEIAHLRASGIIGTVPSLN